MRTQTSQLATTIRDEARRRLRVALQGQSYRQISCATQLSPSWLCTMLQGGYIDPDATKIERLLNYLTGAEVDGFSLVEETRHRYKNRQVWLTNKKISEETGIGKDWLVNFGCGAIPHPGINKIETLVNYLRSQENAIR